MFGAGYSFVHGIIPLISRERSRLRMGNRRQKDAELLAGSLYQHAILTLGGFFQHALIHAFLLARRGVTNEISKGGGGDSLYFGDTEHFRPRSS